MTIVYTPATGVTDRRVFLNGLEFDTSDVDNQVSYPVPSHHDEHFDIGSATSLIASWKAPKSLSSPKYNVYFGTSPTSLTTISTGQTGLTATFTGKTTFFNKKTMANFGNRIKYYGIILLACRYLVFVECDLYWSRFRF